MQKEILNLKEQIINIIFLIYTFFVFAIGLYGIYINSYPTINCILIFLYFILLFYYYENKKKINKAIYVEKEEYYSVLAELKFYKDEYDKNKKGDK